MTDLVRDAAQSGIVIFHEEVARDGAQGKTLLTGAQRSAIAKRQSAIFGPQACRQLVFNAGFPSIGKEEFEAVRLVIDEVDECYVGAAGRAQRADADILLKAVKGARHGRIFIAVPVSTRMCETLLHMNPDECLARALDVVRYILDRSDGAFVDVALADATRADPGFVAEASEALTNAGASMIILCDTVGSLFPNEAGEFFRNLKSRTGDAVSFIAHMHNDLGFGLVNTLEALRAGIFGLTSSWLSLGERSGMPATEQLLFVLGHEPELLLRKLGVRDQIWFSQPNLRGIPPIARYVSQATGVPLTTTTPIVGQGVNSISTGTPFTDPSVFQPFDPQAVLGIPRQVLLTPLASSRVIAAVAQRLHLDLSPAETEICLRWVKSEAYMRRVPLIDDEDFCFFVSNLRAAKRHDTTEPSFNMEDVRRPHMVASQ
ncbi:isopropylmalate/homocitrate/citramalate synthase [Bradyrhizobium sp. BR 10261]|uniref:isopropylmalate/homocitrate/citramalate synthase n=1 Tax=Bradyrhizobium sp. BR 10261 TaxID=2749992 RepID=UPI001C64A2EB|nr:isopropylmalate/homocitrate/citramalate synthase [Bradyrhizobium sp. BR 10261]MBW7967167.1 isopropylmalate/homocitrate/citramalate synthase [Bradyrhizobium sp. BR 10261]